MAAGSASTSRRAGARTVAVWDALDPVLASGPLDVLDIGGGTGTSAVRLAGNGHRVTVVDPSPDALAALDRRAREAGVSVDARQGDLAALTDVADPAGADVVLCHGVLEVVPDPAAALARIRDVLRPGGTLSLLVSQRTAAVLSRALAGHFAQAAELLDGTAPQGRSGRRFSLEEVTGLLDTAGFDVADVRGVRVFVDHVPGALLDAEPGATGALVDLEQAASTRAEYLPFASQVHLLASLR
ncbi:SAM-dependent methyltransferase [Nocardioides luteus]|uniref:Methyltransferase n=1 Tax=Nocardioides luteus TaxID=1844 RepID=A0ABQ5STI2_9ACTN|nr:methyltransferase domain-containing protein [Nocardioides luteus]MDR7309985.1 SAM-dependent methyltransferase [Nocardioides luteus]GGR59167.1 methyltransferase [Nocardioides luteus]GLJ67106.1 methyltransferase [Nocardioides luteus]